MSDRADAEARKDDSRGRMLRRMRRYATPLASETVSPANLPPVRLGLLTKLQLLTVGLVFLTAAAITGYTFWREWAGGAEDLGAQARTFSAMLAEVVDEPLAIADRDTIEEVVGTLVPGSSLAYVAVLDAGGRVVANRRFGELLGAAPIPPPTLATGAGPAPDVRRLTIGATTFLEHVAPVRARPAHASGAPAASVPGAGRPVIGHVQVGFSLQPQAERFRAYAAGALTVVGLLMLLAMFSALLLTRGLVAPMRRLMRAARAVAGGRLDVYVPTRSRDELGLLTQTFNHMTQRLAESQAEVVTYQRTLEDKVAQRTRELEVATAHAYKLAQHDILTGLPNRSLLNQRLRKILAVAQREGAQVACLFLDFDHFKRINDTLGHDAGDLLLQSIAQRLGSAVRESDTVARLGGDEFVLVLPGLDPAHATFEVMSVVHRVRESFLAPFRIADQTPTLTCSVGVSVYPLDAQDPPTLIKQADTAMYAAKEAGRNAYRFYTADMNARVQQRLQIETDMRRGLMDDEFFLVYQPQVDTRTGRAFGVEALLRWRDPERGVVGPGEFIAIAEESGMIQALGARVLRDACRQAALWNRSAMPMRLSVNLSVQQLQHDSWLSIVEDALASSGLPPGQLDLEITESVIITHPEKAVATLERLKEIGVSITVDDFGTGYSSLSYLARLPIQGLKIDQRFVHGIGRNRNDEAITQAIIALAQSLGLRCIAEGIETQAQVEFLRRQGCREAQGFLICAPLEEAELEEWWTARAARLDAALPEHGQDR
ncbi:putative signaling protein [Burkholderiales bacterium]|nr:putative signaling protein [Burkholderiales bacterium]